MKSPSGIRREARDADWWRGAIASLLLLWPGSPAAAQDVSLDTVLARAAAYVADFSDKLAGIVAEEVYEQEARSRATARTGRSSWKTQRLRSDFLLVRPDGADRYIEFRDVFEVDGRAVRDREDRLTRLFLDPTANMDRVRAIIEESARLNIGTIPRNVNTPMLPLYFLHRAQQPRFRFAREPRGRPSLVGMNAPSGGEAMFRVTTEAWVVSFKETRRATIIRTNEGRDFPAAGRYWIDPETGAVLMTELVMDSPGVRAVIDVSYESEPLLGFRVPVEMRERYTAPEEHVDGVARYGRFRQFQVRTDEVIQPPPGVPANPAKPPQKPPPPGSTSVPDPSTSVPGPSTSVPDPSTSVPGRTARPRYNSRRGWGVVARDLPP